MKLKKRLRHGGSATGFGGFFRANPPRRSSLGGRRANGERGSSEPRKKRVQTRVRHVCRRTRERERERATLELSNKLSGPRLLHPQLRSISRSLRINTSPPWERTHPLFFRRRRRAYRKHRSASLPSLKLTS